jgi:PEGA domain-containing protein
MDPALVPAAAPASVTFEDGIGERHQVESHGRHETVELLCLRDELTSVPSFEFALRERVSRLAAFRHASYGHVRSVERLKDKGSTLALVSDCTPGVRLSEILQFAEREQITLDIDAALSLLRQLVPAAALLHENAPDIAHGALSAERIVITPASRIVIVEHVLGSALEQLRFSHERYWKELRIALPRSAGLPRFDHRADVTQLGVVALSLILGRPLADDEYPGRVGDVVASAWAMSSRGGLEPLPAGLRAWLTRALQLDSRNWFRSAIEAQVDLERVLGESDYLATPATLEAFLAQFRARHQAAVPAPVPAPAAAPRPVSPMAVHTAKPAPAPVAAPAPAAQTAPPVVAATLFADPAAPSQPSWKEPVLSPSTFETAAPHHATARANKSRKPLKLAVAALALIALAGAGVAAARRYGGPSPAAPTDGTLVVNTNPAGAHVFVDGVDRGVTPLTVTLKPGTHGMELKGDGAPRVMPITITAGAQVNQYIELPKSAATLGQVQVRTEPAGARVSVDGVARGTSPVMVTELAPGEHAVVLESDLGAVKQTVTVEAGVTASLMVPLAGVEGAPVSGWISLSAPAEVQVFENKRLLGTSQTDRLMVGAGRHDFEIVNETLGYRVTRVVQVPAGKVTPIRIEFPKGTIALNAIPWAEVSIDGEKIGDTPIGNLQLAIGAHEVVFRHPELGEQRQAVTVTLAAPTRLSVDMRKK